MKVRGSPYLERQLLQQRRQIRQRPALPLRLRALGQRLGPLLDLGEHLDPRLVDVALGDLGDHHGRDAQLLHHGAEALLDGLAVLEPDVERGRPRLQVLDIRRDRGEVVAEARQVRLDGAEDVVARTYGLVQLFVLGLGLLV